ncbi:uncharacterized protein LOC117783377 [Drosophila innubila]|uniref:uncharacterized protein LOC117783377 n=1 Tax=Drosophila innubila TaxID=198719 RepID=UPI00148E04C4|nr:uncharacterized protein LOC117783377 [Drosophila innubila]
MGQDEVKNACIDLVTAAKVPLAVLDSKGFKTLTAQIFSGLDMIVDEKYRQIKCEIGERIKNRILCLKMDTATRCNRGILGVNVQFIDRGVICVKTLGMIELRTAHTSQNLCNEIKTILADFSITKEQIYTITTDNGRNMVKAVELLSSCEADGDDEDDLDDEELLKNLKIHSISSIKCAAHTLQLAVKDFLQRLESFDFFEKARRIVKLLRTPAYRYLLTEESLPQPVLDVATRWNSTYTMLSKLQQFEEFCERRLKSSMKLTSSEWGDLKRLVNTLEPAYFATEKLQSTQLFMGDFYILWMELKLTVSAANTTESQALSQCISTSPIAQPCSRKDIASTSFVAENALLSQNSNTCSLLNEFLQTIEVTSDDETEDGGPTDEIKKGYAEIDGYSPKPICLTSNIMEYWEEKRFLYPTLYQLAKVVHSVPATQEIAVDAEHWSPPGGGPQAIKMTGFYSSLDGGALPRHRYCLTLRDAVPLELLNAEEDVHVLHTIGFELTSN